jgi:hypothetical protein
MITGQGDDGQTHGVGSTMTTPTWLLTWASALRAGRVTDQDDVTGQLAQPGECPPESGVPGGRRAGRGDRASVDRATVPVARSSRAISPLIRKPDRTKKTSTPTYPPPNPRIWAW